MNINDSRIIKVSEWKKISELPANDPIQESLDEEFSSSGVYQVAMKDDITDIGDSIVHESINYTGQSARIHSRTYTIRQPKGSHGASIYIRENKLDRDEVMIRYLYTDSSSSTDHTSLEKEIHDTSEKMFGKKFNWKEASAGNDGRFTRILDDCKRLTSSELLQLKSDLKDFYFDAVQKEALENWGDG